MKNNKLENSSFVNYYKLNSWFRLSQTHVVCPWCYNMTLFHEKSDNNECEVCRRTIREEDIQDAIG
jgi:ribosomal protein S27E